MADISTLIAYLEDGESERRMVDSICENLAFYQNIDTSEKVGELLSDKTKSYVARDQEHAKPKATVNIQQP